MNIKIVYATKTKHSRKIAQAIANGFNIQAENYLNNPKLEEVDLLFLVSGIYGGVSDPKFLQYVASLNPSSIRIAAVVTNSAGGTFASEGVRQTLKDAGIVVYPEAFICRGAFLFFYMGHPNQTDLESAVAYAHRVREAISGQ